MIDPIDNCTLVVNADQRDTNGNGFGSVCDADLNNDRIVTIVDLGILRAALTNAGAGQDADFNRDDVVNILDLGILRQCFFHLPGPSGVAP